MELHDLTVVEAVRAMRQGDVSPVEMVQALLARIEATEPRVQAWETVDGEGALRAARQLETRRRERVPRDLLFGLPVGLKDLFDVQGLPTRAGFGPYSGHVAAEDSGLAQHLRKAGAVILGKTVTSQLARGRGAPKTRNPWDAERTPGGSSSGSAAAVAARQVPAAFGTQTGGSTLRPAAYCGIVGVKPTFGRISRYGLLPVSWTCDHAGIFARCVADSALLLRALACHDPRDPYSAAQAPEDFVSVAQYPGRPPRLGLLTDLNDRSEPSVRAAAENSARRLIEAGAEVRELRLPVPMDTLLAVHYLIRSAEFAEVQGEQYERLARHYEPNLQGAIEVGELIPASVYLHSLRLRRRFRLQMDELFDGVDGLIGPAVWDLPGRWQDGMGDPAFQSIFTLFGYPNLSLPTGLSAERLPHGMQIVCRPFDETTMFWAAAWCEGVFGPLQAPN